MDLISGVVLVDCSLEPVPQFSAVQTHHLSRGRSVVVFHCRSTGDLLPWLTRESPEVVIIKELHRGESAHLVGRVRSHLPRGQIFCVCPAPDVNTAVLYSKAGATSVVPAEHWSLDSFLDGYVSTSTSDRAFRSIITRNTAMLDLIGTARNAAAAPRPVLLIGETGSGKDLFARALHRAGAQSQNPDAPYVAENIAGYDDTLFSDAVFGHARGAFTGAHNSRNGMVARASGGTLFLDEIGDLTANSQVKLLRLLEDQTYRPLGSTTLMKANARVIVATCKDLPALVHNGAFREDLFFRISFSVLRIPPLRERREDIPLLAEHFLRYEATRAGRPVPVLATDALDYLLHHSFPGNVRQLRSVLVNGLMVAPGNTIERGHLSRPMGGFTTRTSDLTLPGSGLERSPVSFPRVLPRIDDLERELIQEALRRSGGNQSKAARLLGVSPSAVNKRIHSVTIVSPVVR